MKLEDLQLFIDVANYKSMTAAANKSYLAPQNVSKSIAKLENDLNTTLFIRTRHGCYLTENGTRLYNTACSIMNQYNDCLDSIRQSEPLKQNELTGTINILTSPHLMHLISSFCRNFQKDFPAIKINLIEQSTLYIYKDIIDSNEYDIICSSYEYDFLMQKNADKGRSHAAYLLKKEPLRLFFNKDNPQFTNLSLITNKMLSQLPLALYRTSDSKKTIFSDALEKLAITPNYIFTSNNINLCFDYILNGSAAYLDTTLMFNSTFHPLLLSEISSLPLQEKITICHVLFLRRDIRLPKHVRLFLENFQQHFSLTEL